MHDTNNPYAPPSATIEPAADHTETGDLLTEPRRCGAASGGGWISEGTSLFGKQWGVLVLMFLVAFVVLMIIGMIPVLGLFNSMLQLVFGAGWMVACNRIFHGDQARLEDIFAGFSRNLGPLLLAGLIQVGLSLLSGVVAFSGAFITASAADADLPAWLFFIVGIPVFFVFMFLVTAPTLFAAPLIMLHDQPVLSAIRLSFIGCWRNIFGLFLFGLICLILVALSSLTLFLGLIVLMPILACALYSAYRDIYLSQPDTTRA